MYHGTYRMGAAGRGGRASGRGGGGGGTAEASLYFMVNFY